MIFWLVLGLVLVVLIAPLRQRLLGHGAWRFTRPLPQTRFASFT